jgi:hypothetical protein
MRSLSETLSRAALSLAGRIVPNLHQKWHKAALAELQAIQDPIERRRWMTSSAIWLFRIGIAAHFDAIRRICSKWAFFLGIVLMATFAIATALVCSLPMTIMRVFLPRTTFAVLPEFWFKLDDFWLAMSWQIKALASIGLLWLLRVVRVVRRFESGTIATRVERERFEITKLMMPRAMKPLNVVSPQIRKLRCQSKQSQNIPAASLQLEGWRITRSGFVKIKSRGVHVGPFSPKGIWWCEHRKGRRKRQHLS